MKEILDTIVTIGIIYIIFIVARGMNETQVKKHLDRLEKQEEQKQNKSKEQKSDD